MIKLENVTKFYNSNGIITHALKNVNLELHRNEFVAICGPSGSGKSTLLNVICKQDTFDDGEIYYKGNETAYFNVEDMDDFRKNKIGFIFQNYNIIESYTVLQNVMLPYELKGIDSKKAKEQALEIIKKVGLLDKVNNRGAQLSGGQKQRCVIARALAFEPEILACDEPTGNLDSETGAEIIKLLYEISKDKLVLIVTHNFDEVAQYATRKIMVVDGAIYEDSKLKEIELKDEKEKLDLDYKPISKKINFKVALRNLKNTPKKTLFSSLVIFFASLFILMLYQNINYSFSDIEYYNDYTYKSEDKVIVGAKSESISKDHIENITNGKPYILNSLGELCYISGAFYSDNGDMISEQYSASFDTNYKEYNPTVGSMPKDDNDIYLLVPNDHMIDRFSPYIGDKFIKEGDKITFDFVGIEKTNKANGIVFIISNKKYEQVTNLLYSYNVDIKYKSGDCLKPWSYSGISTVTSTSGENVLHLPKDFYSVSDVKIEGAFSPYRQSFKLYNSVDDLKIVYSEDIYPYLELASTTPKDIRQISIYDATDSNYNVARDLGYYVINTKEYSSISSLEHLLRNLASYGVMILFSFSIIIVYFISYIVMSHIYKTKVYDFNIFRTLGVTKKDMRYITIFEFLVQTVIISLVTYLAVAIIGQCVNENNPLFIFKHITPVTTILYFFVIIILGLLIARRFNKKLFKFSVTKTFKEVA